MLINRFKTQDYPRIAFSVDMLDTGIDVRELVNLVFAKPVRSWIKFWQMIGRGTRVLEVDPLLRKPWCTQKDKFLIIDCWENFEFHKENPKAGSVSSGMPLPVRLFKARLERMKAAANANDKDTAIRMRDSLRTQVEGLPENSVVVKDKASKLHKVQNDLFWEGLI